MDVNNMLRYNERKCRQSRYYVSNHTSNSLSNLLLICSGLVVCESIRICIRQTRYNFARVEQSATLIKGVFGFRKKRVSLGYISLTLIVVFIDDRKVAEYKEIFIFTYLKYVIHLVQLLYETASKREIRFFTNHGFFLA